MFVKLLASTAFLVVIVNIYMSLTSSSSLVLRDSSASEPSTRSGTNFSGRYDRNGVWIFYSSRSSLGDFAGGGPGSGK